MITINQAITHQVQVERYKAGLSKIVNKLSLELIQKIRPLLVDINTVNRTNVNNVLVSINKIIDETVDRFERDLLFELRGFVVNQVSWNAERMDLQLTEEDRDGIVASVLGTYVMGYTTSQLFSRYKSSLKDKIISSSRKAVMDNNNKTSIISFIIGTQRLNHNDGIVGKSSSGIKSLVDTIVQSYSMQSRLKVLEEHYLGKYIWISVLDNRTTAICRARSSKVYTVGKGPVPPAHFRCRSTIAPYSGDESIPESYSDWLKKQDRKTVEDILGKKKASLFLDKKVPLDKFVTESGRELTLKELGVKLGSV